YDAILAPLVGDPEMSPEALAQVIVDGYMTHYDDPYRRYSLTKSAVDLRELPTFTEAQATLAQSLTDALLEDRAGIRQAVTGDDVIRYQVAEFADMSSFLASLQSHGGASGAEAATLRAFFA